jgi:hypothetical protein
VTACFLGYISNNGPLLEELIYALSKVIPFAPMINNLWLIIKREPLFGSSIVQITAPLHTIVAEAFHSKVPVDRAFARLLDWLPFLD